MIKRFCDYCHREFTERDYWLAKCESGLINKYVNNVDICFNCMMEIRKQQEEMYRKLKESEK